MPMFNEDERQGKAATFSREPVGPKNASSKGGVGDQALMDALVIIGIAWLVVFLLAFSLRRHTV